MKPCIGRPPKSGDETLSERLEIRVKLGEKESYLAAADAAGAEKSDWIRAVLNKAVKQALKKDRKTA